MFEKVCTKLGISKLLKRYFPGQERDVMTVAQYKLKSLCVPGGREARLLNPPTLRQREIYDTLALPLPLRIG